MCGVRGVLTPVTRIQDSRPLSGYMLQSFQLLSEYRTRGTAVQTTVPVCHSDRIEYAARA